MRYAERENTLSKKIQKKINELRKEDPTFGLNRNADPMRLLENRKNYAPYEPHKLSKQVRYDNEY